MEMQHDCENDAPDPRLANVVLFDLDGTLTDSAEGIKNGFRRALATVGEPEPGEHLLSTVVGPPMIDTFHVLGFDDAKSTRAWQAYNSYYNETGWRQNAVFDGIEPVLAELSARGRRLAVATSKAEHFANRILDHFKLSDYFEFVAGASPDGARRAKVDVIGHALKNLGCEAAPGANLDVVMVGDRNHDVLGAAHWGIPTIVVEWGYGTTEEADGAYSTAKTPADLRALLLHRCRPKCAVSPLR
jgi:phosphoglycolate phosphatase